MQPLLEPSPPEGAVPSLPPDRQALLDSAGRLLRAARTGALPPLLRGKRLALIRGPGETEEPQDFSRAANELGAHVAKIGSALTPDSDPVEVQDTARLLGRLYDAVECQGLPPALVQQLADAAGIPVYDGLATPSHDSAQLAPLLPGDELLSDKRRHVMQAMLLATIT
ncbi:MAG TPA: ornithine carbamoyltransferase [Ideonella sp.]|uniref:ornithine carbamoyltransferase n=1 Tax=Ideonella sp. TaxID=1929293 RepID=UPI002E379E36|nr:ornithine carbamoyltransferase [Ideonella sp.]HEX5687509.1 ornithine carbamoyltransferase [Ideonella sp.]